MLFPLLITALVASDTITTRPAETIPLLEQGVSVAVHRQPQVPLVSLRLALVTSDPPGYAGAGHLVQHLVEPRLDEAASIVGARVRLDRSADAVVFTITGPSEELNYMARVLREALQPQWVGGATLVRAGRELTEERLVEWETAERHIRSELRRQLFPNEISAAGTDRSAARLQDPAVLRSAWEQMYTPERVSIIAVGDVRMEDVTAAFQTLPAASRVRPERSLRDTTSSIPLAPAEATSAWIGAGYSASEIDPAIMSVITRIVTQHLRQSAPEALVAGEHWWSHHGQAMVLVASVPGSRQAETVRTVTNALAGALAELNGEQVAEAARALRRDLLFNSRTPDRMAGILGEFADRTGDPDEAQRFYDRLSTLSERDVRAAMRELTRSTPASVAIAPQRLNRR